MLRIFPSMAASLMGSAICFAAPADTGADFAASNAGGSTAPEVPVDALAAVNANEDYGSVTVIIDHLVTDQDAGKVTVKNVWSTETAHESLLSQLGYFRQEGLLLKPGILALAAEGADKDVIYVYTVSERQTQIIVDADLWAKVLEHPTFGDGSVLKAHASLIVLATDLVKAAKAAGVDATLLVYAPEGF